MGSIPLAGLLSNQHNLPQKNRTKYGVVKQPEKQVLISIDSTLC